MERLRIGMLVRVINDLSVGTVREIRACCFEVEAPGASFALKGDSIFNVDSHYVTLICDADRLEQYACLVHTPRLQRWAGRSALRRSS